MSATATVAGLTADQGRELLAELVKAKTAWIASIPATARAATIRELADVVLEAAGNTVRAVKFSFQGTIPPPPWPAGPELVAVRGRVQAIRDGAEVLERKGVAGDINPKALTGLRADGAALYDRSMELLKRFIEAPRMPDILKLVPDPRKLVAGIPVLLLVAAAWWYLEMRD